MNLAQRTLAAQAAYYLATGIWPLLHMRSFEAVSGPKTDRWLVKTVGALVACMGACFAWSAARRDPPPEVRLLSISSALALAAVDAVYAAKRRISKIYLVDAAAEAGLIGGMLAAGSLRGARAHQH